MKPFVILLNFVVCILPAICFAQFIPQYTKTLPVLDRTKSYTSKKIDFETEVAYIPL